MKGVFLYFLFLMVASSFDKFKSLVKLMVLFLFINTVITLIQSKIGVILTWRLYSFDGMGPNDYALFILSVFPFSLALIKLEKSFVKKVFYAIVILAYLLVLTRTRSRMGFIGLVLLIFVLNSSDSSPL